MQYETKWYVINDAVIKSSDDFRIIEPVWFSVSIEDEGQYNDDLSKFSIPQRYAFAIEWYITEVNNGGHTQFYDNSTGLVWEDAMKGFQAIGAQKNHEIIKESADRLGGNPSKNREKRYDQMNEYNPEFDDLDQKYYESEAAMLSKLQQYMRDNAADFYFAGEVRLPK